MGSGTRDGLSLTHFRQENHVFARMALAALLAGAAIGSAGAQIRIGLMVSATGPTSAIGIPQKNTGDILPRTIGGACAVVA